MKGIILIQNEFEDTEALTTIDILNRAGIKPVLVNMSNDNIITTQAGNKMIVDVFYKDIYLEDYDFLIIPGGKAVSKYLYYDDRVTKAIKNFVNRDKLVCAICAGPTTIGKLGLFEDLKYTCFPGCEEGIEGKHSKKGVVSNKFITGKAMAYTTSFALEIVKKLLGKEKAKQVKGSIQGK